MLRQLTLPPALGVICLLALRVGAVSVPPRAVASWDFSGSNPWRDLENGYELLQYDSSRPVVIIPTNGTFARAAAFNWASSQTRLLCGNATCGSRLYAPRSSVPRLASIHGHAAQVTVVAWIQLSAGQNAQHGGAFVGGVWEEDRSWRQYAIFMDGTGGCKPKNGLVAHISPEGGPSPGQRYCESRACGSTPLASGVWHCVANTYDGKYVRAIVNGTVDDTARDSNNPFKLPNPPKFPNGGIFSPPPGAGANFSMGANFVHPGGGKGTGILSNKFVGLVGAFSVYDTALQPAQLAAICESPPASDRPTAR